VVLEAAAEVELAAVESLLSSELHAPMVRTAATAQALMRVLRMITALPFVVKRDRRCLHLVGKANMTKFWLETSRHGPRAGVNSHSRTVSGDSWGLMPVALMDRTGRRRT
jgi:hypothetical protein